MNLMKSSKIRTRCEISLVKVLANLGDTKNVRQIGCFANVKTLANLGHLWDKLKRPVNRLIYRHENAGKFGAFVGQVQLSVKQRFLANMQVLVKMSEKRE